MGSRNPFFTAAGSDWASEQLRQAGYDTDAYQVIRWAVDRIVNATLTLRGIPDDKLDTAVGVLTELLHGRALTEEHWTPEKRAEARADSYHWTDVRPRMLNRGDTVRVKADAYDGDMGVRHNGRVGTVADIRNGVVVTYEGGPVMGTRHELKHLERRVG